MQRVQMNARLIVKTFISSLVRSAALLFIAALTLGCAGCAPRKVQVKDVTKNETIVLHVKPGNGSPSSISIAGDGSIVGNAEVQLIRGGTIYKKASLSGPVKFEWHEDWYTKEAELRYVAGTATSGTVTFRYEFRAEL